MSCVSLAVSSVALAIRCATGLISLICRHSYEQGGCDMNKNEIKKHYLQSMGVGPIGFDYCPLEQVLRDVGVALTVAHRHDYYEVIWFTHGCGKHQVEFASYEFSPHTLLFIGRNQIHAFQSVAGVKGHMLRFDEQFLDALPKYKAAALAHELFGLGTVSMRSVSATAQETLANYMGLIAREVPQDGALHHEQMLFHLLSAFLIEAERLDTTERQMSRERRKVMQTFQSFIARLETHYVTEHRVDHYAKSLALTPRRLNEVCQSAAGMSAKKIVAERIMLEAKRYLLHSELSVKEICYRLGFDDPAYFSRAFKKTMAKSPVKFRADLA